VAPSQAGLTALNAAYVGTGSQVGLNGENRFIAQSVSLALGNTAAKTAFTASYGGSSIADATASAYNVIVGNQTAGVNAAAAVAFLSSAASVAYYTNFVKANVPGLATGSAADIDLAVKAAIVGEIFWNATQANNGLGIGSYATATNNLLKDLKDLSDDGTPERQRTVGTAGIQPVRHGTTATACRAGTTPWPCFKSLAAPPATSPSPPSAANGNGGIGTFTITSNGAANTVGAIGIGAAQSVVDTVRTLNITATTALTTGAISGFGGIAFGTNVAATTGTIAVQGPGNVVIGGISGGLANFTTLNVTTGTGTLATGDITGILAAASTINVSGGATTTTANTGSVNLGTIAANVVKIDASGLTAGGVAATIGASLTQGFVGGQGTDVITLSAVPGGAVNGGAGTDIIAFAAGANLTSAATPLVTNFEVLRVLNGGGAGTTQTFDPTLINGITAYQIGASTGAVVLNNLVANPSVTVIGSQSGTAGLALNLANAGGASDAINLRLDNLLTAGANSTGVVINSLATGGNGTVGQVETLNITSAGRVAGTGTYNQVTLAASGGTPATYADANTVNLLGSVGVKLITGNSAHAQKIDASAHTGGVIIDNATTGGTGPFTLIGSAVNDTISSANVANIYAGAGGDSITLGTGVQTIVYKVATDSQLDLAATDAAVTGTVGASGTGTVNASKMDIVNGFTTGTDKIDVSTFSFGVGGLGGGIVDKATVASDAAFNTLLTTAGLFSDGITTRGLVQIHGTAGMSSGVAGDFLIIDANKDGAYTAGVDIVIKFAGTASLAIGDFQL
jgi:S-layer protein